MKCFMMHFQLKLKLQLALGAAYAMEYLHSRSIIHFDVKADNFLCDLRDEERPIVKVADVGLSKHKIPYFVRGSMRGTLPWMAPELFPQIQTIGNASVLSEEITEKALHGFHFCKDWNAQVDVYSFGIMLFEIWTWGMDPYQDLQAQEVFYRVLQRSIRPTIPNDCESTCPDWAETMEKCWNPNPRARPSFSQLTHKFESILKMV